VSVRKNPTLPARPAQSSSQIPKEVRARMDDVDTRSRDLEAAELGPRGPGRAFQARGVTEALNCVASRAPDIEHHPQPNSAIISWRDLHNMFVRGEDSGLAAWVAPAFRQITGILANDGFPCIFARQANHLKSGWACFVDSIDTDSGREIVRQAILAYLDTLRRYSRSRATIMPLMVVVKPSYPMLSLREYRDQAWGLFQYLHEHDPEPWPSDTATDPDRGDWSFYFGGIQLFSNVSDPAHQIHKSRNLGDSLVFAMQPRTNFDLVGGNNKKGRQVRREIRARAERYEGRPVASHLGFFGTPENREWLQMATKDSEADHDYPAVCPFRFKADKAPIPE
jgi:FPC/CPF motif-containing protein YcgG